MGRALYVNVVWNLNLYKLVKIRVIIHNYFVPLQIAECVVAFESINVKVLFIMRLGFMALFVFGFVLGSFGQNWTLTVVTDGIKNDYGKVYIAVYDKKEGYCSTEKAVSGVIAKIVDGKATGSLRLKQGKYSVVVFHDENDNGKLDRYFYGPPKEGYGFSNNVNSRDFEKALFDLNKDGAINIKMRYL